MTFLARGVLLGASQQEPRRVSLHRGPRHDVKILGSYKFRVYPKSFLGLGNGATGATSPVLMTGATLMTF